MDAKGSTEDPALAKAEKEARELEGQLLLKPRVIAMRRIFEDYSGKHPGEVAVWLRTRTVHRPPRRWRPVRCARRFRRRPS